MLDDTGADRPLIFYDDMLELLIPNIAYPYWGQPVDLQTANGVVQRRTIWFKVEWRAPNGSSATGKFWEVLNVNDEVASWEDGATRLSGMSMRARLFTSTSPYNHGALAVADSKGGAYNRIREGVDH
jgi:hypothetical protein